MPGFNDNDMNKALFLDRDGVINKDIGYAFRSEDIRFVDGIFELCQEAQKQDYLIIIVTNQSGIARGYYSEADFQQLNQWFIEQFAKNNILISAIYHCPHHPAITGDCVCRKPNAGMLLEAIEKYQINPNHSMMIGDKSSDMQAAKTANIGQRIFFSLQSPGADNPYTTHIDALTQAIEFL